MLRLNGHTALVFVTAFSFVHSMCVRKTSHGASYIHPLKGNPSHLKPVGRDPDPQVGKITAVLLQLGFPQKNRAFDDTLSIPAGI
jgi:hypothetical protein